MAAATAPVTRYQGVDKQSSGYKLLAAMGWNEGEGLGATRQGIKEHIKVKKKFENWGVGAVEAAEKARDWTTGMLDFTRVLSTLSEITSQHARGRDSGYDSSSEEEEDVGQRSDASDGEARRQRAARRCPAGAAGAEGAAEEGVEGKKAWMKSSKKGVLKKKGKDAAVAGDAAREDGAYGEGKKKHGSKGKAGKEEGAAGTAVGKKRKKQQPAPPQAQPSARGNSSSDSESGSNVSSGSSSESEGGQSPAAAPKRVKFATHVGRFKRREAAKMVKNYSTTDLAAILGGTGSGAAAAADPVMDMVFPTVEIRAERPADSSDSGEGEEEGGAPAPSGGGATTVSGQDWGLGGTSEGTGPAAMEPQDEGKWWVGYFGRAIRVAGAGAGASGRPSIMVHGFREEDQENLYKLAHEGKTQGRVGLGRSSMPNKVAGARWAGKKVRLGSDSEDDEGSGPDGELPAPESPVGGGEPRPGEVHLGNGVVVILPPSRRAELEPLLMAQQARQREGRQQEQAQQQSGGRGKEGKRQKSSKRKQQQQQQQQQQQGAPAAAAAQQPQQEQGAGGGSELAGLKWHKLVLQQLKASGKSRLSVGKLSRAIAKSRGLGKAARARVEELVAQAAAASSKLHLKDGVVLMA